VAKLKQGFEIVTGTLEVLSATDLFAQTLKVNIGLFNGHFWGGFIRNLLVDRTTLQLN